MTTSLRNNTTAGRKSTGNGGAYAPHERTDDSLTLTDTPDTNPTVAAIIAALPPSEPWRNDPDRVARIALAVLTAGHRNVGGDVRMHGAENALHEGLRELCPPGCAADMRTEYVAEVTARAIADTRRLGLDVTTPNDDLFPKQLNDIRDDAPLVLWSKGDLSIVGDAAKNVSFAGSRASTGYGEHAAAELVSTATDNGGVIITGGSYGIEGAATRAALANGAPTAVVLASGLDRPYPAGHDQLIQRVAENGVLISELPPGTSPTKARHLTRNRIAAAISGATVVVEAGPRSGAIPLAQHAKRIGRNVGAVPGPITSVASLGANELIRDGYATLVGSGDDVLRLMKY